MKKIAIISSVCALICANVSDASAEQYRTSFYISYTVAGNKFQPTVDEIWTLPSDLSDLECRVTDKYLSPDGKNYYHNVACSSKSSGIVFGQSLTCKVNSEDFNTLNLFIRAGKADLQIIGACQTRVNKTVKS